MGGKALFRPAEWREPESLASLTRVGACTHGTEQVTSSERVKKNEEEKIETGWRREAKMSKGETRKQINGERKHKKEEYESREAKPITRRKNKQEQEGETQRGPSTFYV